MHSKELTPTIEARIKLLKEFRERAFRWRQGDYEPEGQAALRRRLNEILISARKAVLDAGAMKLITVGPPSGVGGVVPQNLDPFQNFFENIYGISPIETVLDSVDQAIGVYEQAFEDSDLLNFNSTDALDVGTAIDRALRPSFRRSPPNKESEVQDAVENILNSIGIDFVRDREVAPTGPKASRPDFTVESMNLAVEIKLAKEDRGASIIQEEMNADITAYKTKWKRLMFVIYDLGVIDDPHRMRNENQRLFGVSVLIVKH